MELELFNYEIDYDEKLVVTSNDEIGELVVAFNKILDLEKNNIDKIEYTTNTELFFVYFESRFDNEKT